MSLFSCHLRYLPGAPDLNVPGHVFGSPGNVEADPGNSDNFAEHPKAALWFASLVSGVLMSLEF